MAQSLTQLPKDAEIGIDGVFIYIKNHEITHPGGLFEWLDRIVNSKNWNEAVVQMEKHGISFEAAVERCVTEIEHGPGVIRNIIGGYNSLIREEWYSNAKFSKSDMGNTVSELLISKIRQCEGWDEYQDVMQKTSGFKNGINEYLNREWDRWYKV